MTLIRNKIRFIVRGLESHAEADGEVDEDKVDANGVFGIIDERGVAVAVPGGVFVNPGA